MAEFNYNLTQDKEHVTTAGQTYYPYQDNIHIPTFPYTKLGAPSPDYPPVQLNEMALANGWEIQQECHHYIPGVTSEMMDWFWVNMEKCYFLWAPGSHKRFNWVREPWRYGLVRSAHCIAESVGMGYGVFGGNGIQINRLPLSYFPFTHCLEHVIVEGVFNDLDEFVDMTVHMWEDAPGGLNHVTAAVAATDVSEPPRFVIEMLQAGGMPMPPSKTDHADYEAARWPVFLPKMWELWYGHPDPTQNVVMDLTARQVDTEKWEYVENNGPIMF